MYAEWSIMYISINYVEFVERDARETRGKKLAVRDPGGSGREAQEKR